MKIFFKIFIFPFIVCTVHYTLSIFFDIYAKFPHFDVPFHILGGLAVSYSFILTLKYFQNIKLLPVMKPVFEIIFVTSLVCAVIVVWELCEFTLDYFFQMNVQVSLTNTMVDMLLSSLGGFIMACFVKKIKWERYQR
ncbi:MAG: hypothetical protein JW983_04905 [Elusimicrobia bacterium]|nr:hypothetical protein [Elusimicrobiota bacterium]